MQGAVLFVYYKVDAAEHAALASHVRQFQARLIAQWPGLLCELMQRPESSGGRETWMETYRHPQGLPAPLLEGLAGQAQEAGLPAPRHVESFVALH